MTVVGCIALIIFLKMCLVNPQLHQQHRYDVYTLQQTTFTQVEPGVRPMSSITNSISYFLLLTKLTSTEPSSSASLSYHHRLWYTDTLKLNTNLTRFVFSVHISTRRGTSQHVIVACYLQLVYH